MAMLAERKQKQKWSLNPRGKLWSEDTNKFGQKMLEKMGWKSGNGLGAKLDGITQHVKVSYKHDSKGMGYKENGEQWTQHDENFSKLLKSLGEENCIENSDEKPKSLEEISANTKKRVHYRKFTRGKDLSQYSEKQLANIFGKKTLKPNKSTDSKIEDISLDDSKKNKKYGVDTLEGGSMVDYFKNKMGNKLVTKGVQNNGFEIGSNGVLKKVETRNENSDFESESELERPSFGFGFQNNISENNDGFNQEVTKDEDKELEKNHKKSKKRKFNKEILEEVYDNVIFNDSINDSLEVPQENNVENPYEIKPKKKKVKTDLSTENADAQNVSKIKKKKSKIPDVDNTNVITEENVVKIKKKKNNKVTPINEELNNGEIKIKNKKNKKNLQDSTNSSTGNIADVENTSTLDTQETSLKKLKKNKKNKSISESFVELSEISEKVSPKKKTKKQKDFGLENPNFDLNDTGNNAGDVTNEFEVKRKKKDKKSKKLGDTSGLDNPGLNLSNISDLTEGIDESYQEGLSTSIQQNLFEGIENLALNISSNDSIGAHISDVIECDLMLNVAGLPDSAQKKQIERRKSVRFSSMNQEFIIPNNYENKLMEQKIEGLANAAFDERLTTMEENMIDIEQQLSTDCAKVENDLNEVRAAAHARLLVPIVSSGSNFGNICHGNAGIRTLPTQGGGKVNSKKKNGKDKDGTAQVEEDFPEIGEKDSSELNQMTVNGDIRLSYKLSSLKMSNLPPHLRKVPKNTDLASYKHLIKGDIVLGFKKSNLHKIAGYGNELNNKDNED